MNTISVLTGFLNKSSLSTFDVQAGVISPSQEAELLSLIKENRGSVNAEALDEFLLAVRTYSKQYDDLETGDEVCEYLFYIPVNVSNKDNVNDILLQVESSISKSNLFCDYDVELIKNLFESHQIPVTVNDQVNLFNGGADINNNSSSSLCFIAGKVKVKVYEQEHFGDDMGSSENVAFTQQLNEDLLKFDNIFVRGVCFEPTTLFVEAMKNDYDSALKQLGNIESIVDHEYHYQICANDKSVIVNKPNLNSYLDDYQLAAIHKQFSK